MMNHNIYIYIAIMALVSFCIRVLPLTLIRKQIKKSVSAVVPLLCSICNTCRNDISCHRRCNPVPLLQAP